VLWVETAQPILFRPGAICQTIYCAKQNILLYIFNPLNPHRSLGLGLRHISDQRCAAEHVKKNVERKSVLMTDEDRVFKGLGEEYVHLTVRHSIGEYVRGYGVIHTQKIESVWALLKRQIIGIHHWVSPKHLQKYADEMAWRFNRRDLKPSPRMNDMFECVGGRLTYKALIG
jgi:hypothetical protein